MLTQHLVSCRNLSSLFCSAFLLAACTTQSDSLGKEGDGDPDAAAKDGPKITCILGSTTYQVGETIAVGGCTTCVCQQDGTVGMCTGTCPPDASAKMDAPITCVQGGKTYPVGETVTIAVDGCTTCVCQQDGALGMCKSCDPLDSGQGGTGGGGSSGGKTDVGGGGSGGSSADAGVDLASLDAAADTSWCHPIGSSVPPGVTCLTSKDQCIPNCVCSTNSQVYCTDGCRNLPLCADAAPDLPGAEVPVADYRCLTDDDCCVSVDSTCTHHAWLYSKAPGASGLVGTPGPTTCNRCTPPSIQVRCIQGQCSGTNMGSVSGSGLLQQSHCGSIALPDAGVSSSHSTHAGPGETTWGC